MSEMHSVLLYSDLVGGLLGIAGSLVLGYPFVIEMTDRRHWDMLKRFKQQMLAHSSMSPEEDAAYRQIRDRLIDQRLGEHEKYRRITLWGFFLLLVSFVFMTLDSYERSFSSTAKQAEVGKGRNHPFIHISRGCLNSKFTSVEAT
jgi:hypothetical protein